MYICVFATLEARRFGILFNVLSFFIPQHAVLLAHTCACLFMNYLFIDSGTTTAGLKIHSRQLSKVSLETGLTAAENLCRIIHSNWQRKL